MAEPREGWEHDEFVECFDEDHIAKMRAAAMSTLVDVLRGLPDRYRSLMLTFAQYYSDNALDEVHTRWLASPREEPEWPHICNDGRGDLCRYCRDPDARESAANAETRRRISTELGYIPIIPPFEPFCSEGANQDNSSSAYRPYAIGRRGQADPSVISTEVVGDLVRPWLDLPPAHVDPLPFDGELAHRLALIADAESADDLGPWSVLADRLLERGDPRGELLAGDLANAPGDGLSRLRERVGRRGLGSLDEVLPRAGAHLFGGFVRDAQVYATDASAGWHEDPRWLTARSIRFLPSSISRVSPAMRGARALGPLGVTALHALTARAVPFRTEVLEVTLDDPDAIDALRALATSGQLPALRVLRIVSGASVWSAATTPGAARALDAWTQRRSLEALEVGRRTRSLPDLYDDAPCPDDPWIDEVARWEQHRLGCPVRVRQVDPDTSKMAGWSIELRRDGARVHATATRLGRSINATLPCLRRALEQLDRSTVVTVEASRWWSPRAEDRRALALDR